MTSISLLLALTLAAPPADDAFFEKEVRPVLVDRCVKCHGPTKASGGLRVDTREALLKGGDSGSAIVPGKPAESRLLKAIRREKDVEAMPPDKALAPAAVAAMEKWVRDGAVWPASAAPVRSASHWAFEPVRLLKPLSGAHPVDALLGAKPQAADDNLTLVRRVTFDLIGLPPTPGEIDAFLLDASPDAYAKLIDRLLASPHYGEKWGRHWLDVVRYADTAGETADFPVPDAWRYRNYVIAAFNRDLPYDQFLREQLAGDILAANEPSDRYAERIAATGYLALARRFGYDVRKDHFLTLEDTIDTVGKSVLGLTLGCARCHDHKYDPVSAKDYYALYGIFESTRYAMSGCEKVRTQEHLVPLLPPSQIAPRALFALASPIRSWADVSVRITDTGLSLPTAYAVSEGQPHDAQIHKRGDPETRGDAIPRRFLTILGGQPLPPNSGSGRLALADWLTDAKNPLTARVMVNRIWQGHFGTGIVATPNDFGTRGATPTNPELLDWLAAEFVRSGWSVKHMHRLILTSEAYQQGSHRRRLAAEEIRDALLAVSGDLDPSPGGPHPFPDPATWGFTQHAPFKAVYETNRRSVYLMTQRIQRHAFLALFDGPDPNASTATRQTTTVPTQALFFLNDPFVHKCADSLARRLNGLDTSAKLDRACRLLYGRPASDADRRMAERFLSGGDWPSWLRVMLASNEFVYVD